MVIDGASASARAGFRRGTVRLSAGTISVGAKKKNRSKTATTSLDTKKSEPNNRLELSRFPRPTSLAMYVAVSIRVLQVFFHEVAMLWFV